MSYTTLTGLFTAIADALRARTGSAEAIAAQSFPAAIAALPSGTDTSDATATAADILSGRTAYAGGAKLTGTLAAVSVPKHRENLTTGFVSNSTWSLYSDPNLRSDIYRVRAGHRYLAVLGGTAGNRFRTLYLTADPCTAAGDLPGTIVGEHNNAPAPFDRCTGLCTPAADGYVAIFKNSASSGLNAQSFLLDLSAL